MIVNCTWYSESDLLDPLCFTVDQAIIYNEPESFKEQLRAKFKAEQEDYRHEYGREMQSEIEALEDTVDALNAEIKRLKGVNVHE